MKKFEYAIYQIKANVLYSFMNWETANKHGWSFNPYGLVWADKEEARDDYDLLDYLFEKFNIAHPDHFRGHSMSVSDIVKIEDMETNEIKYYYCDSFGWKDITREVIK